LFKTLTLRALGTLNDHPFFVNWQPVLKYFRY